MYIFNLIRTGFYGYQIYSVKYKHNLYLNLNFKLFNYKLRRKKRGYLNNNNNNNNMVKKDV